MLETQRDGLQNNRKQDVQLLLERLAIGYGTPSFQTCLYEPISVCLWEMEGRRSFEMDLMKVTQVINQQNHC